MIDNVFDFITNKCHFSCKHCFIGAGAKLPEELSGEDRIKFFFKLRENGMKFYNFLGGEPVIHPYFFQMYKAAINIFPNVRIQTSGSFDLSNLPYSENVMLEFSLEDSNPAFDENIRMPGHFESCIRNIMLSKRTGFNVYIRATLFQNNDYKGLINLAKRLGVGVTFVRFIAEGRGKIYKNEVPTKERLIEVYNYVESLRTSGDLSVMIEDTPFYAWDNYTFNNYKDVFLKAGQICPGGIRRCAISADGNIYYCQMLMNPKFKLGSINDEWKLIEEKGEKIVEKFSDMPVKGECQECSFFGFCRGGCRFYAQDGKIGDVECPVPSLMKIRVKEVV